MQISFSLHYKGICDQIDFKKDVIKSKALFYYNGGRQWGLSNLRDSISIRNEGR